jgi:predicted  nucleic acid-binding Zn-ribbon protein
MTATAALTRQVRRLQQARRRWKQRVAAKQQEIRKLRVSVRDLSASRDLWKQRYRDLQRQRAAATAPPPLPLLLPYPARAAEAPLGGR